MTLTVAPATARGAAQMLQPHYYTSSLFVDAVKEDMSRLLSAFATAFSQAPSEQSAKPFQIFKTCWNNEGWDRVHFRVLDARARESFLQTVIRLFVDRTAPTESPLTRVGALFGLYTFFGIQPDSSSHTIWSIDYITLTIDEYEHIMSLPTAVPPSLRPHTAYIISRLVILRAFHIIPHSSLGARNPRNLPHSSPILTRDIDYGQKKKIGRRPQWMQNQKADEALSALENFVERVDGGDEQLESTSTQSSSALLEAPDPIDYVSSKERLIGSVSGDTVNVAEARALERIRNAAKYVADNNLPLGAQDGLERLMSASVDKSGLLGLVQPKGK